MYGSPHRSLRHFLWLGLRDISSNVSGAWLAIGNFNALLNLGEKEGSHEGNGVCREFQQGQQAF